MNQIESIEEKVVVEKKVLNVEEGEEEMVEDWDGPGVAGKLICLYRHCTNH